MSQNSIPIVKGRLRERWKYWESIGANENILNVIKEGYRIPFLKNPSGERFKNNKSALNYSEFVSKAVLELLNTGRVVETEHPPKVVNPLSVSVQGKDKDGNEKLRLIIDLRHINKEVYKRKINFEDWRVMETFLEKGGFAFSFDITQGYHHIEMHPDFHIYLGFSWVIDGKVRFFMFVVLPFGLTSAPYIFTKVVRGLVKHWRGQGIKICVYIDDGFGSEKELGLTGSNSNLVRESLEKSGFLANVTKSVWEPTQNITWLGVTVDLREGSLCISEKRVKSLLETVNKIIDVLPYVSARQLSRLTGKIMSTKFVLGNITQLKTRRLYRFIDGCSTWDRRVSVLNEKGLLNEIVYWRNNFKI